jgi:MoaA/NifB/PqqE/SkfB family radical SAM enzyme
MRRTRSIVMDITDRCNLKCRMCYFANVDRLSFPPHDLKLTDRGFMPNEVFEQIATDLFPAAREVALACAAEPLIHPQFTELVRIAGTHRVPRLWFPTNLLALTEAKAEAIVDARVRTVAVSIDGVTRETYEGIRVGARWDRLQSRLDLLHRVRRRLGARRPSLRVIFTWMRSNRDELRRLPAFADDIGASELDVRFVTPTEGVDVTPELLDGEEPVGLKDDLRATAEDAVRRGLWLSSYPEFEAPGDRPQSLVGRLRRRAWRLRAGLERWEHWRHLWRERRHGCAFPGQTYVVRPSGAVQPCVYWQAEPLGVYPDADLAMVAEGEVLHRIRTGLANGQPIGTCATCIHRRDAFYRPFRESEPAS